MGKYTKRRTVYVHCVACGFVARGKTEKDAYENRQKHWRIEHEPRQREMERQEAKVW